MSIHAGLRAALMAAIETHPPLAGALTAVFDAPPVRAAVPYLVIGEAVLIDWGTKDMPGREGRIALTIHDEGERPVRLRALQDEIDAAVAAMPPDLGGGWRVAVLIPVRSALRRGSGLAWTGTSEFRLRALRSH